MLQKIQEKLGINISLRAHNVYYILAIILSVLAPVLAANGLEFADMQTWKDLCDVLIATLQNPYVLFSVIVSVTNATVNFDSKGLRDNIATMNKKSIKEDVTVDRDILIGKLQEELEILMNEEQNAEGVEE